MLGNGRTFSIVFAILLLAGWLALPQSAFAQTTTATSRPATPQDNVTESSLSKRAPGNWVRDGLSFSLTRQQQLLHSPGPVNATTPGPGKFAGVKQAFVDGITKLIQDVLNAWLAGIVPPTTSQPAT
jgi:hypothetical protein